MTDIYEAKINKKTEENTNFMDIIDSSLISSDLSDADSTKNLSMEDVCSDKYQIGNKSNNTDIHDANTTNNSEEKTDFMDIIDSNLISSDLSDAVSNNLADSTENLSLDDVSSEINDDISMNDKESLNKMVVNSKEDIIKSNIETQDDSNVNVSSINENVQINCFNFNDNTKLLNENAVGLDSSSMSGNDHGNLNEIQVPKMDFDDNNTNNIPIEMSSKPEESNTKEHGAKVDDNNNTDVLTQFIEDNMVDFVQTPREFSEILSSLIEFDITANNSCGNMQANTHSNDNDLKTTNDEYSLMDLDSIVDEIETIDSYIDSITNINNIGDLNAITSQDVDNILNRYLNENIPSLLSDINNDTIVSVCTEKPNLQDFELETDMIRNNTSMIKNYDFNIQINVEPVSSEHDYSSQETDSVIIIADSQNNSFVEDKNEEVKQLDVEQGFVDQGTQDTFVNAMTSPIKNMQMDVETNLSENSNNISQDTNIMMNKDSSNNTYVELKNAFLKRNVIFSILRDKTSVEQTNKNTFATATKVNVTQNNVNNNNRALNAKIIDTIILSSSDEEENIPLAIFKKKNHINTKITPNNHDHISISSNESNKTKRDDPNYCSGYESSDFEFITEEEAKKGGITYKKINKDKTKKRRKKTLQLESIERLSSESDRNTTEYPNDPSIGSSNNNFDYNINEAGPSGLNNNANAGPSGTNNYSNKHLNIFKHFKNNTASAEGHEIPVANDYLNLFQGLFEPALRTDYSLENKSVCEPNPSIPGMYIDAHGVGFDLGARQNQPYDDDIDDEARAEARENRNKILLMYSEDNKKRKRRR